MSGNLQACFVDLFGDVMHTGDQIKEKNSGSVIGGCFVGMVLGLLVSLDRRRNNVTHTP